MLDNSNQYGTSLENLNKGNIFSTQLLQQERIIALIESKKWTVDHLNSITQPDLYILICNCKNDVLKFFSKNIAVLREMNSLSVEGYRVLQYDPNFTIHLIELIAKNIITVGSLENFPSRSVELLRDSKFIYENFIDKKISTDDLAKLGKLDDIRRIEETCQILTDHSYIRQALMAGELDFEALEGFESANISLIGYLSDEYRAQSQFMMILKENKLDLRRLNCFAWNLICRSTIIYGHLYSGKLRVEDFDKLNTFLDNMQIDILEKNFGILKSFLQDLLIFGDLNLFYNLSIKKANPFVSLLLGDEDICQALREGKLRQQNLFKLNENAYIVLQNKSMKHLYLNILIDREEVINQIPEDLGKSLSFDHQIVIKNLNDLKEGNYPRWVLENSLTSNNTKNLMDIMMLIGESDFSNKINELLNDFALAYIDYVISRVEAVIKKYEYHGEQYGFFISLQVGFKTLVNCYQKPLDAAQAIANNILSIEIGENKENLALENLKQETNGALAIFKCNQEPANNKEQASILGITRQLMHLKKAKLELPVALLLELRQSKQKKKKCTKAVKEELQKIETALTKNANLEKFNKINKDLHNFFKKDPSKKKEENRSRRKFCATWQAELEQTPQSPLPYTSALFARFFNSEQGIPLEEGYDEWQLLANNNNSAATSNKN